MNFVEGTTNKHRDIFNWVRTRKGFKYTNKQISAWSGFDESKLSRFFSGKRDLKAGEFFYLLESMPKSFQELFWSRYNPEKQKANLDVIIADMDVISLVDLVNLAGEELSKKILKQNTP
ncbi:MAG: hypothetical protein QNJ38_01900 [Prochloraceae cyanobacterium]|nr:hypothetical protein [Prochloraceae cyanobacterium]